MIRGWLLALGLATSAWAGEPARIAALGVDVEETVAALGHGDDVVAVVEGAEDFPSAAKVGVHRRVATEPLLSTRPTVVIAGGSVGPADVLDAVEAAGVPVTRLPKAEDLDAVRANIRTIAEALGQEPEGKAVIAALDAQLARVPKVGPEVRVAFLYARGAGTMMLAGKGTIAHTVIAATGATPVGDWEGYRPITDEALVALGPTHLLLTTGGLMSLGGVEAVQALPPVALLGSGVRVLHLPDRLVLSSGPKVGDAVHALAAALGEGR